MATIDVRVSDETVEETRGIRWALDQANAARAALTPPLPALANRKAFLDDYIAKAIPSWVAAEAASAVSSDDLRKRWKASSDAQRTAAQAALAPAPP